MSATPRGDVKAGSIRRRLTRRLLIEVLSFAVVSNVILFLYLRSELIERYDEALSTEARSVASLLKAESSHADLAGRVMSAFPRLHLKSGERGFLQVWREDGSVAVTTTSIAPKSYDKPTDLPPHGHVTVSAIDLPDGDGGRAATMIVDGTPGSKATGWVMLLGEPTTELDKTLLHMTLALTVISGGMCVCAVFLVVNGARRELLPLDTFAEAVGAVRAETLGFRFETSTLAEELQPIAGRMNDLLERLGDAFDRERRFSGNLAHELRTPIAEMRTMLEVASRWPPDALASTKLHHDLLSVAVRTSALLEALLSMVRQQQGRQPVMLEPTPLRACIDEAWESHAKVASERGLTLSIDVPADLAVTANHAVLVALVSNLLENAASYASTNTAVTCRAATTNGKPSLTIENLTTELHAADLPRLHEPFWRKDAARVDRAHAGLGLALVREYAAAMRVELDVSMPEEGRLIVRLTWAE